jgi:mannosyl-3-phosphoglycerate phosphatase
MHKQSKLLIFTDLDGTLIDYHTYSKKAALPSLEKISEFKIPLIIVSSKTRAEIEPMLDLPAMAKIFIAENGSAVFFHKDLGLNLGEDAPVFNDYSAIILGERYENILKGIRQARKQCGIQIQGFSEMSVSEISKVTGLDMQSATLAKAREFSEPFLFDGDTADIVSFINALKEKGISCVQGGRFLHALGRCDKGQAARKVIDVYKNNYPDISWKTMALGDSENDIELLKVADIAVTIKRHDSTYMNYIPNRKQRVIRPQGIGPAGWNEAVENILKEDMPSG